MAGLGTTIAVWKGILLACSGVYVGDQQSVVGIACSGLCSFEIQCGYGTAPLKSSIEVGIREQVVLSTTWMPDLCIKSKDNIYC